MIVEQVSAGVWNVKLTAITDQTKTRCKDGKPSAERLLFIEFMGSFFEIRFVSMDGEIPRATGMIPLLRVDDLVD